MKLKAVLIAMIMALMSVNGAVCANNGLIEKAKSEVNRSLKDPEATRFRNVRVKKGENGIVIGEFNAKNSFGGYVGYEKFYYDSKSKYKLSTESSCKEGWEARNDLIKTMNEIERAQGLPLTPQRDPSGWEIGYKKMFVDGW